jgi:DNA uptake protein ComE-like DNA-binding protein
MTRTSATLVLLALLIPAAAHAQAQTAPPATLVNANTATPAELSKVPGLNDATAKALVGRRPFASMTALDTFLGEQKLTREQRTALYERLFVPVNLNTASDADILLIPRLGKRMLGEFKEYRPYKAMEQFRREIGKYVDKVELARLERYVTIN